ncbi:Gfo/Idh/MocA family oxidoreductase [Christiangramia crocea]|uniref:Gfo/Idh/MocA family oxidoreductase n=1 Tax=Christiangramia crocea TaxID=2904124 RepID=A0A9X1UXU5_9FLAO|nr:Gfo/Idh/MocA family oxidoreductase [Gramella crocea]MCG9971966.1 Gfo/Idh/MocA family oxidoreductase [Gramella crocea]
MSKLNRRTFISRTTLTGMGLSIVPSQVLGGTAVTSPNDKINVALIGAGTQAMKMLPGWLERDELQFVSVCDPNRESWDYPQWGSPQGETHGAAGGREVGRRFINDFYAKKLEKSSYDGVSTYADFRELLEKEKDLDAVFILTPDHLHATIALAAMEKGLYVATHKPISNFMNETRLTCDMARKTGLASHCFAFQNPRGFYGMQNLLKSGVIGEVKEFHRWTNRPMWPQGSPHLPVPEPVPEGFDWQLWLGPSIDRPYSPAYTHTVFRGWYEFGAGCMADMGYYGFWKDWRILNLGKPDNAEGNHSKISQVKDFRSMWVENNVSYPHAGRANWEIPVLGEDRTMDVFWYEGGIRPRTPKALIKNDKKIGGDGVMFIGENGSIISGYAYEEPVLFDAKGNIQKIPEFSLEGADLRDETSEMIDAFKGVKASRGSIDKVQNVAETICLGNLAIRMDDRLEWDIDNMRVTNNEEANQYVSRDYRPGWEL